MKTIKYTFWQDGEFFIGFLNDYPDYETQAYSKEELIENLKDLLKEFESGEVPFIRKVEETARFDKTPRRNGLRPCQARREARFLHEFQNKSITACSAS